MTEPKVNLVICSEMMIDGRGGPPISPAVVAVAGSRIVFAGSAEDAPEYPEARRISMGDSCLLPGLIDMHVHPTYYWDEPDLSTITHDGEGKLNYTPVMIGLLAAKHLHEALMAGITTVRDVGSVHDIMFDVKRAVKKKLIPSPKLYVAGRLIVPTAGHVNYLPGLSNEADGPYGFRRAVREEVRAGADFIKIAARGADMRQEELNAAVDEAHRLGKKVACHVYKQPAISMAIEAGVDTFEHGDPTPEDIDLAVQKGIAWTPTINIGREHLNRLEHRRRSDDPEIAQKAEGDYKERFENVQRKKASFEYALKAGLKLSTGTDSFPHWVRFAAVADEMCCLVDFGCTPMQAIQAATQWPAQAMGWNDIGSLEAGKLADLIAVEGDPISDLSTLNNVLLVLREGEIVKHIARDELKNSK